MSDGANNQVDMRVRIFVFGLLITTLSGLGIFEYFTYEEVRMDLTKFMFQLTILWLKVVYLKLILQILNWPVIDLPRLMQRNLIRKLMHMQIALRHLKPKLMN